MKRHTILFFVVLLLYAARAAAQDPLATVNTSRSRMQVGEQATVTIAVSPGAPGTRIGWPVIPDSIGALEVVKRDKIDTLKENGKVSGYRQSIYLTGWDSSTTTVPPFVVNVTPPDGAAHTVQTTPLIIAVSTVPVDTAKPIRPIKGIMEVEGAWLDYVWWLAGGLLLLIAAIILYARLRKRRPVPPAPPPAPPEPAHQKALRLLGLLESEGLWQKGEVKEYYVRLTDILRHYIEARFSVPALERTTDELVGAANAHTELVFHRDRLYQILSTADMAKFARAQPSPQEHVAAMQTAKEFVTATIPEPVITAPANPET